MSDSEAYQDAFNLLCGDKIGEGIHRTVYECRIRPDLVVKVENADFRYFANILEHKFWSDHQYYDKVARWLAPCETLSPDGRVSLQKRADPLRSTDTLPEKVPGFLTDLKRENFGWLGGRLVCLDYAMFVMSPNVRLKKAHWD